MRNARTRMIQAAAATALAVGGLAVATPAHAQSTVVNDGADASGSLGDIYRVTANHRAARVYVTSTFADLRPTSTGGPSSVAFYLDVKASRPGPEYAFVSGMQEGTDYQLSRVRDWKLYGDPMSCDHRASLNFTADQIKFDVARSCIGTPANVRVAVRMVDEWDGSHVITDWMKGTRAYTKWLRKL